LRQYRLNDRALSVWLTLGGLLYVAVFVWLLLNKPLFYSLALVGAPIALVIVTQPKLALLQFVVVLFIERAVKDGVPVYFMDISAALVVITATIDICRSGRLPARLPAFTWNFVYIGVAMVITAVFGYWPHLVGIRLLTWAFLLLTFLSLYRLLGAVGVARAIRWFFAVAVVNSIFVLVPFVASRGIERSFGFSGVLFDDLALIALPVGLSLYLDATRARSWPYLAGTLCCLGGLLATQSRLSIMFGLTVSVIVVFIALRSARQSADRAHYRLVRGRLWQLLGSGLAILALALLSQPDLLSGVLGRFQSLADNPLDRSSTASYRLHLWERALTAFRDHPILGVGPGGYGHLFEVYSSMHLSYYYHLTHYMGAHNVLLEYLANMGLVGGLGLLAFVGNTVRLARRSAVRAPRPIGLVLLAWATALTLTVLIEGNWMWGQLSFVMAFFSALIARQAADAETGPASPAQ